MIDLTQYRRRATHEVRIGACTIGGTHPVAVQSMTNTDTRDTAACVAQIERIARAGAPIVRLTAQGVREAENLRDITERLRADGNTTALVADIHFLPEAAAVAAQYVDKVRINPGNYRLDRGELEALVARCRERGVALRIGVNHGSLSKRIFDEWGDTPEGMVAAAMEFLHVCRREAFDQVVVSMKSSNTRVMVAAYRLLVEAMEREGMTYPIHLGVTEAGNGLEGRIKSAVGIGALLADGIGDTIRVSLTEAPEREIPVARQLADYFAAREGHAPIPAVDESFYSPYEYRRRRSEPVEGVGGDRPPVIWSELPEALRGKVFYADIHSVGEVPDGRIVVLTTANGNGVAEQRAFFLRMEQAGKRNPVIVKRSYRERSLEALQVKAAADTGMLFLDGYGDGLWIENETPAGDGPSAAGGLSGAAAISAAGEARVGDAMSAAGGCSGKEQAAQIAGPGTPVPGADDTITPERIDALSLAILQAARVRISKAEYIACPSCGRTLYDLQETLAAIKARTAHLVGVKIGVMGCIVNGPGEMADADYGYVGAGPGRITLYRGREVVRRGIPQAEALDELVALLRADGKWREP